MKHTDGPWTILALDGGYHIVQGAGGRHVTDFVKPNDANLIAAAPDLLAACKGVLRLGRELDKAGIINDPAINALRDAIAKAEGLTVKERSNA